MKRAPTDLELQAFFEEVWQLAERTAATEDSQLSPYLFELAEEIAVWRDDLKNEASHS
jgi:hypothetical protein